MATGTPSDIAHVSAHSRIERQRTGGPERRRVVAVRRAPGPILLLVLSTLGCASPSAPSASPSVAAVPPPVMASPTLVPTAMPTPRSLSQIDYRRLAAARRMLGLVDDRRSVEIAAFDPAAVSAYGALMTFEEKAGLDARRSDRPSVIELIEGYGVGFPDAWAGLFIDTADGAVVARFTRDLTTHEQRIRSIVSPNAVLRVRPARWSLGELTDLRSRIERAGDWFASMGIETTGTGLLVPDNVVTLRITSANTGAPHQIVDHFDAADMLRIRVTLPPWHGPTGGLRIRVVGTDGVPAAGVNCVPVALDPAASNVDAHAVTGQDGICAFDDLPSVTYDVRIAELGDRADSSLARIELGVRSHETTTAEVYVRR